MKLNKKTKNLKRQSSEKCAEKRRKRRGIQIIESKKECGKEGTERGKIGGKWGQRERGCSNRQKAVGENVAFSHAHSRPKVSTIDQQIATKCRLDKWRGRCGKGREIRQYTRPATIWINGNACQGQTQRELLWQIAQKKAK